jgi:DNA-binding MarR family transcriptional regulator
MEAQGLVRRRAQPADGRVRLIALAPAGQKKMRAEQQGRRGRARQLMAGWPTTDQVDLGRLLGRLNDAICNLERNGPHDEA